MRLYLIRETDMHLMKATYLLTYLFTYLLIYLLTIYNDCFYAMNYKQTITLTLTVINGVPYRLNICNVNWLYLNVNTRLLCRSADYECFSVDQTTLTITPSHGEISTIYDTWVLDFVVSQSTPKRHLDRFCRFCRFHECDQQTDTQTDRPRYSICIDRPHLLTAK